MFSSPGAGASMINPKLMFGTVAARSDIEAHVNDVSVAHDVVLPLEALLALFTQRGIRAGLEQLLAASLTSARMNPLAKSVWILPAASRAV